MEGGSLKLLLVEVLEELGADFHHHPLEFEGRGGFPSVVVKSETQLSKLASYGHPHLLLVQPQR